MFGIRHSLHNDIRYKLYSNDNYFLSEITYNFFKKNFCFSFLFFKNY